MKNSNAFFIGLVGAFLGWKARARYQRQQAKRQITEGVVRRQTASTNDVKTNGQTEFYTGIGASNKHHFSNIV